MSKNVFTYPWTWRSFGGPHMLVTQGGGAMVVACAGHKRNGPALTDTPATMVRGTDGVLVPITPEHPVAVALAAVPDVNEAANFALSVLVGHGMYDASERIAVVKLEKALALQEGRAERALPELVEWNAKRRAAVMAEMAEVFAEDEAKIP